MSQLHTDAKKIHELFNMLEVMADDNKCKIDELPENEVVKEAEYCLYTFTEDNGHYNWLYCWDDEYLSLIGKETRTAYRRMIPQLKRFIKKYEGVK